MLLFYGVIFSEDWPHFMGPSYNNQSRVQGINKTWKIKQPKLLWKISMNDNGYAGPAAAGGIVYIVDYDPAAGNDVVKAIDLNNGNIKWSFSYPTDKKVNYGQTKTTPAVSEGKLYTYSKKGILFCLDAKTGKSIWSVDILSKYGGKYPKWEYAASPFIDGGKVILLSGGDKNIIALDKNNGSMIWQGGNAETIGYATPVKETILGITQYLVFTGFNILGVSDQSGAVLWQFPWNTSYDVNAANPVFVPPHFIFITSGYNKGCAMIRIDQKPPQTCWHNKEVSAHFSSPTLYKDHLYASSDPGFLVCLNPHDGSLKWKQRILEKGGFIIADEVIIALHGGNGLLTMAKADSAAYTELGSFVPLGGQSWTTPILAGKNLIIRNKQFLACIDLTP